MEIESAISLLIEHWKKQGIKISSVSKNEIEYVEKANNIQIPNDFKNFYSYVNGMENLYPNEMDNEGFLFYPIEAISPIEAEFINSSIPNKNRIFIFSEYMQRSWWYGYEVLDDEHYRIGIIPDAQSFVPITNKLPDFINLYLNDDSLLYEY